MGLRDKANHAWYLATGQATPDAEELGRRQMIDQDPTKADDESFWGESFAELVAQDLHRAR
jgi:hypothetical protein